jgi:hypothetical protein
MKKILPIILICCLHLQILAQKKNPLSFEDYSTHIFLNMGGIRHEVKTNSENNMIKGIPAYDASASFSAFYFFKNHPVAISLQGNCGFFSSQYITKSGYYGDEFDGKFKEVINLSSYLKLGLNYNYSLTINSKMNMLFFIGSSILIQSRTGNYDNDGWFNVTSENGIVLYTFETKYSLYKTRKETIGSQFGVNLLYKAFKRNAFLLTLGYSLGFQDFYEQRASIWLNNVNTDNAIITGRGSGFYGSLGFSIPLNL